MSVAEILPMNGTQAAEIEMLAGRFTAAMEDNNATFLALRERFAPAADWKVTCRTPFSVSYTHLDVYKRQLPLPIPH